MNNFTGHYAVIFTSKLTGEDIEGYKKTGQMLEELAKQQPGYLGFDSARSDIGISVSYWESEEDIRNWKRISEHFEAQQKGREVWYESYSIRVCKIERDYQFHQGK